MAKLKCGKKREKNSPNKYVFSSNELFLKRFLF